MTNWYAPGEVKVTKLTKAELDAVNDCRKKEREKYKFRNDRKAMSDLDCHAAENQNAILKKISQ